MTEAEEYLEKQEGYNIESILENPDFRLAIIELLQSYAEEHLKKKVEKFNDQHIYEIACQTWSVRDMMDVDFFKRGAKWLRDQLLTKTE